MSDYTKTNYPNRPTVVTLPYKPAEGTTVQRIEVSLTDDTIHKLAQELARQINLMGGCR